MRRKHVILRIAGVASLLLAALVLGVGYGWLSLVWSGGEYAEPRPGLGVKFREALPSALGIVAAAAIPGIIGVILFVISRPVERADRGWHLTTLSVLLGVLIVIGIVFVAWGAGEEWTGSYGAASTLMYIAVVDAFLILLVATREVVILVRGSSALRGA